MRKGFGAAILCGLAVVLVGGLIASFAIRTIGTVNKVQNQRIEMMDELLGY